MKLVNSDRQCDVPAAQVDIFPRLAKSIPDVSRADVFLTLVRINVAGARPPGFVLTACLKTLFSGWNTTRRCRQSAQ
eukprot:2610078-Pyramimonas_sp.AAC.1